MDTQLTFPEEIAVSSAITLRIIELSNTIHDCRTLGQDCQVLLNAMSYLKSAFRKLTGVDFDSVSHNKYM